MKYRLLKPTKQKFHKKRIFGFDIETYDDNRKFLMASLVGVDMQGDTYEKVFHSKDDLINELKTNYIFRDAEIYATNLSFDFFGTFFNKEEAGNFITPLRGSNLLYAKTYFKGKEGGFTPSKKPDYKTKKTRKSLTFIDSMNYAQLSVEKMGQIVGVPKMTAPECLGKKSWAQMTDDEREYMTEYNLMDSRVTYRFMKFLINAFEELGGTFKLTIASSSMSIFKNRFLKDEYFISPKERLRKVFEGYYGGRTEALKRGEFKNAQYYDFNSLYPSVMHDYSYPDPNSERFSESNTQRYIKHFDGVSKVTINIPYMKYPPLPYRDIEGNKVIFPYGRLTGVWTNYELRYAMGLGATIENVEWNVYYTRKCSPFKDFVDVLYRKRLEYKRLPEYNPMEFVIKIVMNSLYGKFGEKFDSKPQTIHKDAVTNEQLDKMKDIQAVDNYIQYKEDMDPKSHCIPIWAVYVTAYGRIKLHKELVASDGKAIYCDTDSIVTTEELTNSDRLGDLKLEMSVKNGIVVRPKMYALFSIGGKDHVKIKGCAKRYRPKTYEKFKLDFIGNPTVAYMKFSKFREALRSGDIIPNQIILAQKEFSLDDTKRDWHGKLFPKSTFELEDSDPVKVE